MRIAVIALFGLPLAGCFGVTLPPKQLPEWAMTRQAEAPAQRPGMRRVATRRASARTENISNVAPAFANSEVVPFSAEWQAREDAFDNKLRRTMSICRAC